jgi:hypothetical protein
LRLYPEEARMTSYTYAPLVGVTSKCDINNNIVYHEYDMFNRLSLVRDLDLRILKKYCYGNAGQQEDCSGQTFFSIEKTNNYTRNNCGTGYSGSSVTYTVPTGTYISSVSQAIANQMAQDDLDANGQVYANINGVCNRIYSSADYSNIYYSQTCGSGETPEPIYVSIPAGSYTSIISQQDANDQALQYAQNYANQNGTCSSGFALFYDNSTFGVTYHVLLTNTSTLEQSLFHITSSGTGILGYIPPGTYDIYIYNDYGWYFNYYYAGCGHNTSGYSANFYSVPLNDGCNTITVQ